MGRTHFRTDDQSKLAPDGEAFNITHYTVDRQVEQGNGERTALSWIDRRRVRHSLTYAEISDSAKRAAKVLVDLGVQPGDVVAVLLPRNKDFFFVALGAWKIGAVFAPLLSTLGPGPIASRLEISQAKVLVTTPSLYVKRIAPQRAALSFLSTILKIGDDESVVLKPNGSCLDMAERMSKANSLSLKTAQTTHSSPAFLHFTSGTTGTPKGTIHSHGTALSLSQSARQLFELEPNDVFWCTAEPGWVPFTAYGIIAPLSIGCTTLIDTEDFDTQRWYSILVEEKVTAWYTSPSNIRMMMSFGAALARSYRKFSLRVAASGGAPLHAEAVAWSRRALGIPFLDSWWQTETGSILIANHPDDIRPGSMGRPLPGISIQLVKRTSDGFEPVTAVNEIGELAVKADIPSMFIGYAGTPETNGPAMIDGWFLTGDHVRQDADGFLWFVGRCDDLFKYKGYSIGPFELENALLDHPAVAETAVIGKPDPIPGQIPVAFVTLNPGFEAGERLRLELLDFSRQILGAIAPEEIYFYDNIPKTTTGCILRRSLREHLSAQNSLMEQNPNPCQFPNDF
jgi:acetyl-CoA synthetase